MKASLENLKVKSNWKQHPTSSIWWIIDWDGEYFKKHKETHSASNRRMLCIY